MALADHKQHFWSAGRAAVPDSSFAFPLAGLNSVYAWNRHSKWKKVNALVFMDYHLLLLPSQKPLTR